MWVRTKGFGSESKIGPEKPRVSHFFHTGSLLTNSFVGLIKDTARKAVKAVKDWARCFFKRKCDNPEHIPPPPNPQDFVTIPPRDGDERETEEDLTSANPGPAPPTESNEPDTTGGTIQITWYDDNNKVGVDGKPIDKGVPGVITSDGGTSAELARMQQQKQTKKNR